MFKVPKAHQSVEAWLLGIVPGATAEYILKVVMLLGMYTVTYAV